jgi:hypothetical protein
MTLRPRRIALQIVPLVDTLLVVLFLQYLDAKQREAETVELAADARRGQQQAGIEVDDLRRAHDRILLELAQARDDVNALSKRQAEVQQVADLAQNRLDRTLAQQRVLGELVVELFGVPQEEIEKVLDPAREPPVAPTPEELERLRTRFREMSRQDPGRMIRHLLSYEEIRKRCDVWELHVDARNIATLDAGRGATRLRVEPGRFEEEFFDVYKALPQPKGLVIILLTYDRQSLVSTTEYVGRALQRLVDRMREDSGGRTRFEYADLGVRVD